MKQVGRELGVRYVLEGGVRKSGNRIRVSAQLVEAETGNHIWAERYDRDLADIFAVQDEISEAVTIAIAPAIRDAELRRAVRKSTGGGKDERTPIDCAAWDWDTDLLAVFWFYRIVLEIKRHPPFYSWSVPEV